MKTLYNLQYYLKSDSLSFNIAQTIFFLQKITYKYDVKKVKIPSEFKQAYPDSKFYLINQDNYLDFIT